MLSDYQSSGKKGTRDGFGDGLHEAAVKNYEVVGLCADLTGSLKMNKFKDAYPERFFQVGIAEANMMSLAAGMAIVAKYLSQVHSPISLQVVYMIRSDNPSHTQIKT